MKNDVDATIVIALLTVGIAVGTIVTGTIMNQNKQKVKEEKSETVSDTTIVKTIKYTSNLDYAKDSIMSYWYIVFETSKSSGSTMIKQRHSNFSIIEAKKMLKSYEGYKNEIILITFFKEVDKLTYEEYIRRL
jgi:hypothetical protein